MSLKRSNAPHSTEPASPAFVKSEDLARLMLMAPPDLAAKLIAYDPEAAARIIEQLPAESAAAALAHVEPARVVGLLNSLDGRVASAAIGAMRPDDRMDVLELLPTNLRRDLMAQMGGDEAEEIRQLERHAPDSAGGIMTTEAASVDEALSVETAVVEVRRLSRELEHFYYIYVTTNQQQLVGVLSMRDLLLAEPAMPVTQIMRQPVVTVLETADQEQVARTMQRYDYVALPVVDSHGRLVGIVTIDDVMDVLEQEATEDIQKMGATEALDSSYLTVGLWTMLRKRGGWLSILFLGEMLTATAMGLFEDQIAKAVVLALFVPIIISSGGNAGSQAATLVIRSLALGELKIEDWLRVLTRELQSGLFFGLWLGGIGFLRIILWQYFGWAKYGDHYLLLATTIWLSLIGVVLVGTLFGAMLPLLIDRLGFDPASGSTPFVATLVDVAGLVIYFTIATYLLSGTLL